MAAPVIIKLLDTLADQGHVMEKHLGSRHYAGYFCIWELCKVPECFHKQADRFGISSPVAKHLYKVGLFFGKLIKIPAQQFGKQRACQQLFRSFAYLSPGIDDHLPGKNPEFRPLHKHLPKQKSQYQRARIEGLSDIGLLINNLSGLRDFAGFLTANALFHASGI
jgi:hypothetical protein